MSTTTDCWNQVRKTRWFRVYRARIRAGLEHCRMCQIVATDLTFDHIVPRSLGGRGGMANATILCAPCNQSKGDSLAWWDMPSLRDEEEHTGQRWSQMEPPPPPPPPSRDPDRLVVSLADVMPEELRSVAS